MTIDELAFATLASEPLPLPVALKLCKPSRADQIQDMLGKLGQFTKQRWSDNKIGAYAGLP